MTFTQTRTGTLTTTLARVKYVTRKVQADLLAILDTYGYYPEEYALRVVRDLRVLLDEEVIRRVNFVWVKKGTNSVIDSLAYTVVCGDALPDDDTGDILYNSDLSGSAVTFCLVIYWSQRWLEMGEPTKARVRERLELGWENNVNIDYGNGWWVNDRIYSKGGYGLERQRFQKAG